MRKTILTLVVMLLAPVFLIGVTAQTSPYDPWCDMDDDGDIDIYDVVEMAGRYGTSGTPINKTELLLELLQRLDSLNASIMKLQDRVQTLHGLRLAGCWKFEERDVQTVYDSSGYGNDGTISGVVMYMDGWSGYALRLLGYVNVTIPDDVTLNCTAVTLEACMLCVVGSGDYQTIVSKWGDDGFSYALELQPDGITPQFAFYAGMAHYAISNITVPQGSWAHIAGTYDGEIARIYVNGTLAGSSSVIGSIQTATTPICIGSRSSANVTDRKFFSGIIDEVRIYNYALTVEEILADMNG